MAIGTLESQFELEVIKKGVMDWKNISLCEMGNMERKVNPKMIAKEYYTNTLGVRKHVSIDINGEWGALPYNLDKPVPNKLHNTFDIVTNYGTGEHVDDQYSFFKNVHTVCKTGGIMIHALVYKGSWPEHCRYYYDENFVEKFITLTNYAQLKMFKELKYRDRDKSELLMVALKKTKDSTFPDRQRFETLPITDTKNFYRSGNYTKKPNIVSRIIKRFI